MGNIHEKWMLHRHNIIKMRSLLIILTLYILSGNSAGHAQCDIQQSGLVVSKGEVEVGTTVEVSFSIFNAGTDTQCAYPAGTVTAVLSIPAYMEYNATSSPVGGMGAFFQWTYDVNQKIIKGINHTPVGYGQGEASVTFRFTALLPPSVPLHVPFSLDIEATASSNYPFNDDALQFVRIVVGEEPSLALSHTIIDWANASSGIPGNKDLTCKVIMLNTGNTDLIKLSVLSSISLDILPVWVRWVSLPSISGSASQLPLVNAAFDGGANPNILDGTSGLLKPGEKLEILYIAEVNPNKNNFSGIPLTRAEGIATPILSGSAMNPVSDFSDDGLDPVSSNPGFPGDTGGTDDYTQILIPAVSTVKYISGKLPPASGIQGHYDVLFNIGVKNVGNTHLTNITLRDTLNLPSLLGSAFAGLASGTYPKIIAHNATMPPIVDSTFNGSVSKASIFKPTTGNLAPGQEVTVQLRVAINGNHPSASDSLWNSATASATAALINAASLQYGPGNTLTVTDRSDAGSIHESTNPDQPEDQNTASDRTLLLTDGSIGSLAWHDVNGDGQQNPGEPGMANVVVTLFRTNGVQVASTTTDANGAYQFELVAPGSYFMRFAPEAGFVPTFRNKGNPNTDSDIYLSAGISRTLVFVLGPDQENLHLDAGFYQCVTMGDFTWYDANKNDIHDPQENGINGIEIFLWRNHFGEWIVWDYTVSSVHPVIANKNGYYSFCVPPGEYYLEMAVPPLGLVRSQPNQGGNEAIDSDLTNAFGQNTTDLYTFLSGGSNTDIDAGFYPMATTGNMVWIDEDQNGIQDDGEQKLSGVLVQAIHPETHEVIAETVTNENGVYILDYLEKGRIYLKFYPPAGYTPTVARKATDDQDSDVDHSNGMNTTRIIHMLPGETYFNMDLGLLYDSGNNEDLKNTNDSSVKGLEKHTISLYPNPAYSESTLYLELASASDVTIELYDQAMRRIAEVYSGKVEVGASSFALNLNGLAAGMYTVQVNIGKATFHKKLIRIE